MENSNVTRRRIASLSFAAALAQVARAQPAALELKPDLQHQLTDLKRKVIELSEAIPQERFGWRPSKGARSLAEVLLHVASSGFVNGMFLGARLPAGVQLSRDPHAWETSTSDKSRIMDLVSQSFDQMINLLASTPEDALSRTVKVAGVSEPLYRAFLTHVTHIHEHLGLLIAYARMNDVVPPWSN